MAQTMSRNSSACLETRCQRLECGYDRLDKRAPLTHAQLRELAPVAAAQNQARAVLQRHPVFPVKEWFQLLYPVNVDDHRAADPHKLVGRQPRFDCADRLAK